MPRSGTVFLGECLGLHADIEAYPNEIWEFPHDNHAAILEEYISKISGSYHAKKFEADRFTRILGDAWMNYFYSFATSSKRRILMKSPNVQALDRFFDYFPNAFLLVIVRDGRDVVASGLKSGFVAPPKFSMKNRHSWRRLIQPADFRWLCQSYAKAASQISEFERSSKFDENRSRIMRVKFEDLCADTEETISEILDWAALDPKRMQWEDLHRLPVKGSSFLTREDGEMDFSEGVQKTEDFKPLGRWKSWTPKEKSIFESEAGEAQAEFGGRHESGFHPACNHIASVSSDDQ